MSAVRLAASPKHPPYSLEAEQSVLGGLLLNNRAFYDVMERLDADDFYTQDHRVIYAGIAKLLNAGQPCDFVTLSEQLRNDGILDEAGGISYLGTIAADTPSAANIRAYADIVRERSVLRRLIGVGQDIGEMGYTPDGRDTATLLAEAEQNLLAIRSLTERRSTGMRSMSDLAEGADMAIDRAVKADGKIEMPTGITELDKIIRGLHPGDLIIVGGRPAMGKSAFAQQVAEYVIDAGKDLIADVGDLVLANAGKVSGAMFSMEMSGESIATRSYARRARVDLSHLLSGELDDAEWARLANVGQAIRDCALHVEDASTLSHFDVAARAKRHKARYGLRLIVVDHMNLMAIPGFKGNRTAEVSEISRGLKALAMELKVPVIALTQLNRGVEARQNKRPLMSDLRESGSIEQDADVVLFVYRDDYYNKDSEYPGQAEIIVAKHRNGPTGTVRTVFQGKYMAFDNLAPQQADPGDYPDRGGSDWDDI